MRINISLDDVSPHPIIGMKSVRLLKSIAEEFTDIKVTLFVPTALCRFKNKERSYYLNKHIDFVNKLRELPSKNFEIGYHGHKHGYKTRRSNNDEFRYVSQQEALDILNKSRSIFDEVDLPVQPIFRPPGFWINNNAAKACKTFGIKTLALSNKKKYRKGVSQRSIDITYVGPQPSDSNTTVMLFHAGKDQRDYLGTKKAKNLRKLLKKGKHEFVFMREVNGKNG